MFNGATARALGGYESVVAQLAAEGRIDPDRVGIIGFSRTCDTVMYAITHNPRLFAAATIANGLTYGPLQYFSAVDSSPVANVALQQWDLHYQGKPFGSGLSNFLRDNPIFSVAAVATPVRIETRSGRIPQLLTTDWESYAALRSLDKPVDLIMLPYASHVVSMPSDVLASQQGEVDWMRFWLQGYEEGDPAKADQYRRWEKLCDLQAAQNPGRARSCVRMR
jgi:dipeptidyl aminopeptidase/acylaminoacyl peptidase